MLLFHFRAMFYHLNLKDHPASILAPGVFVFFAMIVLTIRTTFIVMLLIIAACAGIAYILSLTLLSPPNSDVDAMPLSETTSIQ